MMNIQTRKCTWEFKIVKTNKILITLDININNNVFPVDINITILLQICDSCYGSLYKSPNPKLIIIPIEDRTI